MRETENRDNPYLYKPGSQKPKKPLEPEQERNRYYDLVRIKTNHETLKKLSWINVAVLGGALFAFFIGSIVLPKPTESVIEKRKLAQMPKFSVSELFQGSLTRDIETAYADTFPLREWFVTLSAVVDESRGVRVDNVRIVAPSGGEAQDIPPVQSQDAIPQEAASQPETPAGTPDENVSSVSEQPSSSQPAPSDLTPEVVPGPINNGTFVYNGMAMSLFGGNPESGAWYASVLNTYHEELPGVQIYNMIIPTAIEFYVPDKYRDLTQSQKSMIDYVYSNLADGIKTVDAYSKLAAHTDEYIYFRTDHHWTGLGAYYAYTAFCEQAGFTPLEISDFETRRLEGFIGTMYAQTQDSTLLKNPDYVDYYIFQQPYTAQRFATGSPYYGEPWSLWGEYAQSPNSYSVFLHGDFPLISVQTGIKNGRKIMVVKESFGNAFAPFLINHYEEVYIVDQRYFQLPAIEFIKEHGINELIFANNSFACCTPYHIRCIDGMRHQVFVPVAQPAEQPQKEETQKPEKKPEEEATSSEEEDPGDMPPKRKLKITEENRLDDD